MEDSLVPNSPEDRHLLSICAEAMWLATRCPRAEAGVWLRAIADDLASLFVRSLRDQEYAYQLRLGLIRPPGAFDQYVFASGVSSTDFCGPPAPGVDRCSPRLLVVTHPDWPQWTTDGGGTRRSLIPQARWDRHPLRYARTELRLDEFIVYASRVSSLGEGMFFTMQLDRVVDRAWSEDLLDPLIAAICPKLGDVFAHRVWRPAVHQGRLLARISPIQREILPHLVEGKTERAIAESMRRSPHTIHDHVKSIYEILGVTSRVELVDAWYSSTDR